MAIHPLLQTIIQPDFGEIFYTFSNADGKIWHIPQKNMRVGMQLYQPSGRNGILMKNLFPLLHGFGPLRSFLKVTEKRYKLRSNFAELVKSLWGNAEFEFSIFEGTPSVHQKITIQISEGNRIAGYCKISDQDRVTELFFQEEATLNFLRSKGMTQLPECLFCGPVSGEAVAFIQSTSKTTKSRIIHAWAPLHERFLQDLSEKTLQPLPFHSTDYYQTLQHLKENLTRLSPDDRILVGRQLDRTLEKYGEQEVSFSAYHADFTPWNMFLEGGELFVFDWEYAQMTYPPYLDYFHFFTQTAIFEKHWDEVAIFKAYRQLSPDLYINDQQYRCYLLDVISRFLSRETGAIQGDVARCIAIWIRLLSFLD